MELQGDRPDYWDTAKKELSRKDDVLHGIINQFDDLESVSYTHLTLPTTPYV